MTVAPGRADVVVDVPLGQLVVGADHMPGIDLEHLHALLDGTLTDDRPITVAPLPGDLFEIRNGRHRYLRDLIRGCAATSCEVR